MFEIRLAEGALGDLADFRKREAAMILDQTERMLAHQPAGSSRRRKMVNLICPPFEAVPPIWQLRVGDFRVFYDIDETEGIDYVRAVRRKPPHRTTEDIL